MGTQQSQYNRIAITGHTSGIGLATKELLSEKGFKVSGFSRANGFDLSKPDTIANIVEGSRNFQVFINNAFCEWAQIDLLYALFDKWYREPRIIINISSNSGDGDKNYPHKYAVIKSALDKAAAQLNNVPDNQCRIVNIRPGWVSTPGIAHLGVKEGQLSPQDIAYLVHFVITSPQIHIPTMTVLSPQ